MGGPCEGTGLGGREVGGVSRGKRMGVAWLVVGGREVGMACVVADGKEVGVVWAVVGGREVGVVVSGSEGCVACAIV